MASYSLDLRERVVKAHLEEGQNKSAVARRFGVSRWSVGRYVKRFRAGDLAATPHPGKRRRLDAEGCEVLRRQVESLDKLVQAFCDAVKAVTPDQVLNTFEHCGYEVEQ